MQTQSSKQSNIKANQAQIALKAAARVRSDASAEQPKNSDKRVSKKALSYDFVGIAG